jgi:hypothetical protein
MGVSCVYRLLASAFVALIAAGCASIPYELDELFWRDAFGAGVTGTLDGTGIKSQDLARKCHDALVRAAEPYGLTKATTSRIGVDGTFGPVWVTTVYRRQGGPETRRALVDCHFNMSGAVVALTEH